MKKKKDNNYYHINEALRNYFSRINFEKGKNKTNDLKIKYYRTPQELGKHNKQDKGNG